MANIDHLAGHIPEPYQKTRVLEAARTFGYPFTLSEAGEASGVAIHIVHRVLTRAIKDGTLMRSRMSKCYPTFAGGRAGGGRWVPAGRVRRVYLYSFA